MTALQFSIIVCPSDAERCDKARVFVKIAPLSRTLARPPLKWVLRVRFAWPRYSLACLTEACGRISVRQFGNSWGGNPARPAGPIDLSGAQEGNAPQANHHSRTESEGAAISGHDVVRIDTLISAQRESCGEWRHNSISPMRMRGAS